MTSKQRAELKAQAMGMDSIFQIGKSSLTPQAAEAIKAALKARELIKVNVLKNCGDDPAELAGILAERTGAEVVQVIGKKIILYKKNMQKEEKRRILEKRKAAKKKTSKEKRVSGKTNRKTDVMRDKKRKTKRS